MTFEDRYKKLNTAQKQAVDTIDGPLLVVAGPGTGKTELLSMRVANILQQTDTLPENILCLTFTDSGATAMRARLASIIGPSAYKVAIQTFHSFGTETINHNAKFFYQGARFNPADEIATHDILLQIFDSLDYNNPLASKMNGEYTHLRDTLATISELKQAGLTSSELLQIIDSNEAVLDAVESDLAAIFTSRISKTTITLLAPIAKKVADLPLPKLPPAITPLANNLALSLAHAFDAAVTTNKTTPITAWKNAWLKKDSKGNFVFKDRERHIKLRAVAPLYDQYLCLMRESSLFDYDDMILNVVQAIEREPELKYNLQERYHYILVDEFQDTNLAQLRILFNLTDNPLGDDPNIMAVGDDDQAIYSFQGADVGNIHRFRERFPNHASVVLTDNYRSGQAILDHAREVITQADGRLETTMQISKQLTAHAKNKELVQLHSHQTRQDEYAWIAKEIAQQIATGTKPNDIAVISRRHRDLVEILPYLHAEHLAVNYERRNNVLDDERIQNLELLSRICIALHEGNSDEANSLLPDLITHPMYNFAPIDIWKLSLMSYQKRQPWIEAMLASSTFSELAQWLVGRASKVPHESAEAFIDQLVGANADEEKGFISPFYQYYFGEKALETSPEAYLEALEALRTIRDKLRDYAGANNLTVVDFVKFIQTYRELGTPLTSIQRRSEEAVNAINLMTAHKSKGLEFDTVFVINSIDSMWGEKVRSRQRLIGYPENLTIAPNADTYDERLRLYFVAMTRAKRKLFLTYSLNDPGGKDTLLASFLSGTNLNPIEHNEEQTITSLTQQAQTAWRDQICQNPTLDMKQLLAPTLQDFKLAATHLNNFIDLTRGGPNAFLMNNLLHFPQAKSPNSSYGTAVHATLQKAHNHLVAFGNKRPIEDVLGDFLKELQGQHLTPDDYQTFAQRGSDAITAFLNAKYDSFTETQKSELNFANQGVVIEEAKLTGSLDLVDIIDNKITVTDYKTGKPSNGWNGSADYEKVKLHKYRQQLMFYQLLCQNSRDYSKYEFAGGILQFVEPDKHGEIHNLEQSFSPQDLEQFQKLIIAVWRCINTLEFPPVEDFEPNYKGILAFEQFLVDKYYSR